jgi:hypothetical protein
MADSFVRLELPKAKVTHTGLGICQALLKGLTKEDKVAYLLEQRAREQMREIYRKSGHNFTDADIEKLCDDAESDIKQWADFARKIAGEAMEEAAQIVQRVRMPGFNVAASIRAKRKELGYGE